MVANAIFFYIAGTDTSRATSTSLLHCLGAEKEAREQIFNDIKDNLLQGKLKEFVENPSMVIDWDRGKELNQFLLETMRLWGIANVTIYRKALKNHLLGDIKIKKGTRVSLSTCQMHRSPYYFPDPEKFDISRFTPEKIKNLPRKVFMPFSAGSRQCSGQYLGKVLTKCVLLSLLSQFEVKKDENFDPFWIHKFTLEMPSIKLKIRPRQL